MSIKLEFEGFDELIADIEKAGGSVDSSVQRCMKESAEIMNDELKASMKRANVPSNLIEAIPSPTIEAHGNEFKAKAGYRKGNYDPHNPSDGYKVIFLNYGTPNRSQHGKIAPGGKIKLGFIKRAKKNAKPKIKKKQEETLKEILGALK